MDEALDPEAYIYEGVWTDWSRGSTWGLTLTLCPDHAVLVTSALAVFVTLAGSQMWTITRFTLHQTKPSPTPEVASPTEHTKHQLILRNVATDLSTARLMASLAWSSRRDRIPKRTVAVALIALLHAALFILAGTFSNKAIGLGSTEDGSPVLSISKHCGLWNYTHFDPVGGINDASSLDTLGLSVHYYSDRAHKIQLALQYAQECYLENSTQYMSSTCNSMKSPKIQWTVRNGSCPFNKSVCHNDASAVVLETAVLDSHNDLGINARPNERLTYQRRTTCAVLNDTDHVRNWDGDIDIGAPVVSKETAYAFYGPVLYMGDDPDFNFTYTYSNFASLYDNFTNQVTIPYQIGSAYAVGQTDPQWTASDFEPIPELVQDSADIVLFFLSFTGRYITEVNDPWFSAHDKQETGLSTPLLETMYRRDSAISTMGCTEQHQFCTHNSICTDFLGFDQVQNQKPFNDALNAHQNVTFDRLLRAANAGTLGRVVEDLGQTSTPIQAVSSLAFGKQVISLPLPNEQWQVELDFWHSIAMAQIQRTVIQWNTGQIAPNLSYLEPPVLEPDKWFCNSLMIPSTVYSSFSLMSIILILIFGTLVIAISLNVERIAHAIRRRRGGKASPKKGWEHDDMLKLTSRIRDSIFRPKPPPKDSKYQPSTPSASPVIIVSPPSTRYVHSAKSDLTAVDESWKRSSSPTLPLDEKHFMRTPESQTRLSSIGLLVPPSEDSRYNRDSWLAISLNDEETNTTTGAPENPYAPRHKDANDGPPEQSTIFRNFNVKGPRQYHLPLKHQYWI